MSRRLALALVALAVAAGVAAHVLTLRAIPHRAMSLVFERVGATAGGVNAWLHPPRVTPASRNVVRPSPDLIYSICVYDLSGGPVDVSMSPSANYHSLSLYDARTDNFFVVNDRALGGQPAQVRIVSQAQARALGGGFDPAQTAVSATTKGVALIRRLATSDTEFADAEAARPGDVCAHAPVP